MTQPFSIMNSAAGRKASNAYIAAKAAIEANPCEATRKTWKAANEMCRKFYAKRGMDHFANFHAAIV